MDEHFTASDPCALHPPPPIKINKHSSSHHLVGFYATYSSPLTNHLIETSHADTITDQGFPRQVLNCRFICVLLLYLFKGKRRSIIQGHVYRRKIRHKARLATTSIKRWFFHFLHLSVLAPCPFFYQTGLSTFWGQQLQGESLFAVIYLIMQQSPKTVLRADSL